MAPADRRVDLTAPTFSDPMAVTNPLHPGARTDQVIYGGQVDGGTFRTEFTRLPEPKRITWAGRTFDAVTMQYLAFQDGRVAEVALDWFAQADDGAVWYIGEDVFNYEEGVVADTEGTWVAGPRTPAAMIMPARPRTGDVYRPENAPGVVFEEVLVRATDRTVPGPSGPVSGAAAVRERSADGVRDALLRVAQDELDLRLPYGDVATVDRARAGLWAGQAGVDAAAGDAAGVLGDVAAFEWTWQRVRPRVPGTDRVEALTRGVRAAAAGDDLPGAARGSAALAAALAAVPSGR